MPKIQHISRKYHIKQINNHNLYNPVKKIKLSLIGQKK